MSPESNEWLKQIARRQTLQKECCSFCAPLSTVCANKKEGGSIEFDLSVPSDVKVTHRKIECEPCYIVHKSGVIYEKNKV